MTRLRALAPWFATARGDDALAAATSDQLDTYARLHRVAERVHAVALMHDGALQVRFRAPAGEDRVTSIRPDGRRPWTGRADRHPAPPDPPRYEFRERMWVLVAGGLHTRPYEAVIASLIGNLAIVRFPCWRAPGMDSRAVSLSELTPLSALSAELLDAAGRPIGS